MIKPSLCFSILGDFGQVLFKMGVDTRSSVYSEWTLTKKILKEKDNSSTWLICTLTPRSTRLSEAISIWHGCGENSLFWPRIHKIHVQEKSYEISIVLKDIFNIDFSNIRCSTYFEPSMLLLSPKTFSLLLSYTLTLFIQFVL